MCVSARYHWRKSIGKPAQELQLKGISGIKNVPNSKISTSFVSMTDLQEQEATFVRGKCVFLCARRHWPKNLRKSATLDMNGH
jgi:hypothetical protein